MNAVLDATRKLLTSLDPLPHPARMSRLVHWARTSADRDAVCADLRAGGAYERRLAAVATGEDRGTDVADLPREERGRLYRRLRARPDPERADAMIATVRERFGAAEAAALLPACGEATVRALLPELEHEVAPHRLLRRHPGPLLDRARERLSAAAVEDRRQVWSEAVLRCDPAQVLDLLERYAPEDSLPGPLIRYGVLAAHDARRVAGLLTAPDRAGWLRSARLPRALLRRLGRLPAAELAPLAARLREDGYRLATLLDEVAPSHRTALYDLAMTGMHTATWTPVDAIMEVLPRAARIREATRMLGLPRIREREAAVQTWSAYLAWPEASAALEGALRSGDADERAAGYQLLVDAARRSRDPRVAAEVVERLGRLRNEQDPVRRAALTALTRIAPLLTAPVAPGLARLTTDAVEARDASAGTTIALSGLAADVLQHHVDTPELREWALFTIDRVSGDATVPVLRRFDTVLRRGQEALVFARLRGWAEAGMARARYGPLFALTHAFGRRAYRLPELQELLRRAAGKRTRPWVARQAIELWLADPRTRSARVAEVLAADPSAVVIGRVWETICASRTDLLIFKAKGRFTEGWTARWPFRPERWVPRQHAAFVKLQARIVADHGQGVQARALAVRAAARIPGAGLDLVRRHLDAPEVPIAEAALGALAWTDRPADVLPLLLGHAGGDRARVAVYAAGRAARHTRPSTLATVLGAALAGPMKITSRKEVVRLLGRLGPPESMATLHAIYTAPDTHRDVRAAIVATARQRLEPEQSWTVLHTAVDGAREERRAVLSARPATVPERHRPRYAALIARCCRAGDAEVRREAFSALAHWTRWTPDVSALITDRLAGLGTPLTTMETAALVRGDAAPLRAALDLLVLDPPGDDPAADQPARRRIDVLTQGAAIRARTMPDRTPLIDVARALADRPDHLGVALRLLVELGRLDNLDEIADRCAGRPVLAARIAAQAGAYLRTASRWTDPRETIARLTARGDLAGGLIAVELARHGASVNWHTPWRELLTALRAHPDPDVRDEALSADMTADAPR
ncbi:hypothetical protein [Catenuloplanes japonicus]|uniref:hypothetical protein n=1 Tax=Catenuloplanes japonicus TaxID=33876 RepID=UPI000524A914|nr:hypothetical protein [Catenuloplanes japonicus]